MNTKRLLFVACIASLLISCKHDEGKVPVPVEGNPGEMAYKLGGLNNDNLEEIPVSTKFGYASSDNLPSAVDLTPYLPPIGDQGSYGTCVSWAAGYYAKTAIEGIAKGYTASQLSNPTYQISARDLFTSIPEGNQKGKDCGGSTLTANLDLMQQRGVATLGVVPYTNLGDCSKASASPSWDTEAAKHKIKSYRTIEANVLTVKQQLASKSPIMIIAKLSDNFMSWNSDNVLSSNTTYNTVGQHAYHGVTIVGYDDRKGAGGAFKVVNSWGTSWGTKGFIWVDYNFLINTFVVDDGRGSKAMVVMSETATKPDDNKPNPTPTTKGVDLVAWINSDASTGSSTSRTVNLNIYNDGSVDAKPQTLWTAYYIYYNSRNANDYGVLFHHTYTTKNLASGGVDCGAGGGNCNLNVPIPAGSSLSEELFGNDEGAEVEYNMPSNLNGSYYLVMIVDADGTFDEADEDDNFFYSTDRPIRFRNGYGARVASGAETGVAFSFKNETTVKSPEKVRQQFNSAIKSDNLNAYSPQEIFSFIHQQRKSGAFARKIQQHDSQQTTHSIRPAKSTK